MYLMFFVGMGRQLAYTRLLVLVLLSRMNSADVPPVFLIDFGRDMHKFPNDLIPDSNTPQLTIWWTPMASVDYIKPLPKLTKFTMATGKLTEFPNLINISSTLVELNMYDNNISVFDYIPPMPALRFINLSTNALREFPDLNNIRTTIEEITIYGNCIPAINNMPPMPRLRLLNLADNALKILPDLQNVSASLHVLDISGNDIVVFPDLLLVHLIELTDMRFGTNNSSPVQIPNACYMGRKQELTLHMKTNQVVCDETILYAMLGQITGKLVIDPTAGPLICHSPDTLAGRSYASITTEEFLGYQTGVLVYFRVDFLAL